MFPASSLTGLLCRLLLMSSVAYEDINQITIEFSTPRLLAPSSMLFCLTSPNVSITRDRFSIDLLQEGGNIFSVDEATVADAFWETSSFFAGAGASSLNPLEVSTVSEVLGTDGYYGGSFKLQRYDDLRWDQDGQPLSGLVDWPNNLTSNATTTNEQRGNCFTLTGAWKAFTRYQLTFLIQNPPMPPPTEVPYPPPPPRRAPPAAPPGFNSSRPPPAPPSNATEPPSPSPPPPPEELRVNNATPIVWIAPLTSSIQQWTWNQTKGQSLLFSVRGNKYGAACTMRPQVQPVMGRMFDACEESRARGLGPPEGAATTVQDCLMRLRLVESEPENVGTLPFTAPPLTAYSLSSFPQDFVTCAVQPNTVLAPRFGGECVRCGTYGKAQGNVACVCPPNVLANLVGDTACGLPIVPDGSVTALAGLPKWLCDTYSAALVDWQEKRLLAHNVVKLYLNAFMEQASPMLDWTTVTLANQTFYDTLVFDNRLPYSPTRRKGLKPNCNRCTNGRYKDAWTKETNPIFDFQFDAMNTFRFLGYLLDQAVGYPCPALWNSQNPRQWGFGYYEETICVPMPEGTCCADNFEGSANWVPPPPSNFSAVGR